MWFLLATDAYRWCRLRGMHFSASIAQLIATFIMTVLRVAMRRKITRGPEGQYDTDINQVNTKPQPRTSHVSELPDGRELHHIAKYITKCKVWKVVGLVGGSQDQQCPAHHFLEARITLAEISGPSWQSEVHQIGSFVAQGIELMIITYGGRKDVFRYRKMPPLKQAFFGLCAFSQKWVGYVKRSVYECLQNESGIINNTGRNGKSTRAAFAGFYTCGYRSCRKIMCQTGGRISGCSAPTIVTQGSYRIGGLEGIHRRSSLDPEAQPQRNME